MSSVRSPPVGDSLLAKGELMKGGIGMSAVTDKTVVRLPCPCRSAKVANKTAMMSGSSSSERSRLIVDIDGLMASIGFSNESVDEVTDPATIQQSWGDVMGRCDEVESIVEDLHHGIGH